MIGVREFSVAELDRIARPGAAVPVLFWLIPLGTFEHNTHEQLRALFCDELVQNNNVIASLSRICPKAAMSFCRDLGALLVREDQLPGRGREPRDRRYRQIQNEQRSVPARELQSELQKVLGGQSPECPLFLVLSSAFPEPGWGVLLKPLDKQAAMGETMLSALCDLWDKVAQQIRASQSEVLEEVQRALRAFKSFKKVESENPEKNAANELEGFHTAVRNLEAQLVVLEQAFSHKEWSKVRSTLGSIRKSLQEAIAVPALSAVLFDAPPASVDYFLAGIPNIHIQVAFRLLSGEQFDRSFDGMLAQFEPEEAECVRASPSEWADRLSERLLTEIAPKAHKALELGVPKADRWLRAERERMQQLNNDWQLGRQQAMQEMVTSTANSLAACRKAGPHLLVEIERRAAASGFKAISVAEDQPRMVGWKLVVAGASLHGGDLIPIVQDALPAQHRLNDVRNEPLGGQHFTDYIHYVARHSPGQSPRDITLNVLSQLLSARELRKVSESILGSSSPPEAGKRQLAETCLEAMGWPAPAEPLTASPLLDNLLPRELSAQVADISGSDLRRSAESFAKDFLYVTLHQLSNGPLFQEGILRSAGVNLQYGMEMGLERLTLGDAHRWIRALGSVKFANKLPVVKNLCERLNCLNEMTKPWVHDYDERRQKELLKKNDAVSGDVRSMLNNQAPALVQSLLDAAAELIKEMPWHVKLQSLNVVGDCRVATVTGWSHSYIGLSNKREILLWHRPEIPENCLVWNESRLNPVMTNCQFISRCRD